jgi:hypothetical protein
MTGIARRRSSTRASRIEGGAWEIEGGGKMRLPMETGIFERGGSLGIPIYHLIG